MPFKHLNNQNTNEMQRSSAYFDRPRLNKLMENAMNYRLVAVYAGAGYGKTRAVYSFLQKYDAHTTWLQLSERDNMETRFWESFVHMISLSWPEAGNRLLEIGFPDSEKAFSRFEPLVREAATIPGKHVMVYDDFHLLHNAAVLNFLEKAFRILPSSATVVLISRTMPEIDMTGMMMYERIFSIREDTLRFTEDEIASYFSQLSFKVSRQDVRNIHDDTRGWAFAINLLGRSLRKDAKYERYTLEAIRLNIFKLIETETVDNISESLWRLLLRISLIENHAASLVRILANDDALIEELEVLSAYIRYDYYLCAYMIHNLFLDYLRQYQYRLSDEEKTETYQMTGVWCEENQYHTDALSYYEKAGDWNAIFRIVNNFKYQMPPDLARYTIGIFERIPTDVDLDNPLFPALSMKLRISLGLLGEASAMMDKYIADYEKRPNSPIKNRALAGIFGVWALMRTILCPHTDVYDFDKYCEKQREYFDKSPYNAHGPITNLSIGAYALMVGTSRRGAPEEFIEAMSRTIPHLSHMHDGCMYGFDDLARGELFFYRREFNSSEQYLKQALNKACSKGQYDIQNRALLYLMQIALAYGDNNKANSFLRKIENLLDAKAYATRYEIYDIARSHYLLALDCPEEMPDWLKDDFSPCAHPVFLENYANSIKAQYHYCAHKYDELLAFLESVRESQTLLIGKIVFTILEALSLYQLKRKSEAVRVLSRAYKEAEPNKIIVPFTQYAKDMRTLTAAALKDETGTIPKAWLEDINRKASAFQRRRVHMISQSNSLNMGDEINLTKRETEILKDLSHGLSRSEIAANRNLAVNSVKMNINIIYEKLQANNLVNAVRIAADRKII